MYNLPKAGRRGMMVHEFCKKEGYCVKYIFQFARITAFCLAGEVLAAVLPLPIPASVYGLLLLAAALKFGVLKLDQVRETGLFLTGIFPLLFVPAAAGVMELGSQLMNLLLPAVLAIVPITALVMPVWPWVPLLWALSLMFYRTVSITTTSTSIFGARRTRSNLRPIPPSPPLTMRPPRLNPPPLPHLRNLPPPPRSRSPKNPRTLLKRPPLRLPTLTPPT